MSDDSAQISFSLRCTMLTFFTLLARHRLSSSQSAWHHVAVILGHRLGVFRCDLRFFWPSCAYLSDDYAQNSFCFEAHHAQVLCSPGTTSSLFNTLRMSPCSCDSKASMERLFVRFGALLAELCVFSADSAQNSFLLRCTMLTFFTLLARHRLCLTRAA